MGSCSTSWPKPSRHGQKRKPSPHVASSGAWRQMRWTGWASLFWHLGLGLAAEGSGSRPEPRGLYAFLDCPSENRRRGTKSQAEKPRHARW